ncbi:MAG TPA: redoxin domain-containing protein [Methylomirabilota bacterium]|nr:redoxin domain-containing protein [Methylomirabilota bacterium]
MKNWRQLSALLSCLALANAESHPDLFRVRAVTDAKGISHQLGGSRNVKVIVLVFLGPECPISQRYVPELNRIATQQKTNATEFYGVVSGRSVTRAKAAAFAREYAITFPVIVDEKLALARWLRPTHVPEAYVLRRDGDLMYHGRIDDGYAAIGKQRTVVQHRELRDAIAAVLAGRTPPRIFAPPVGCYFEELPER